MFSPLVVPHGMEFQEVQADCLRRMIMMMHIFLLLWMMLMHLIPDLGMFESCFKFSRYFHVVHDLGIQLVN